MAVKILYIINNIDWFWSHRLPLALAAKEAGYEVIVAAAHVDAGQKARLEAHGFTGETLPDADRITSPLTVLANILAIAGLIRKHKPTLMHVITIKYAFLAGLAARLFPGLKVVHTIAGLGYLFSSNDVKPATLRLIASLPLGWALRGAQIIFQNPDDRDLLIKRGFTDAAHAHLIRGSGVDTAEFKIAPAPSPKPPLVLMATRLLHDKGVAVFIEAAKIMLEKGVKARFQIAGGEVTSNPLAISKDQMEAMVEGTPVEWLGRVEDMPALLAECAVFVYPSYYREGIPKVLLEAAASGKPIVTTDHPGCREVVEDGVNGFLVPVRNASATAEAARRILEDAALRASMGKASRRKAEEEFNIGKIVTETLAVYKGIRN
jgi:glycosyltransferase involved in cell wall biosynthesis